MGAQPGRDNVAVSDVCTLASQTDEVAPNASEAAASETPHTAISSEAEKTGDELLDGVLTLAMAQLGVAA